MGYQFSDAPKTAKRARAIAGKLIDEFESFIMSQPALAVADEKDSEILASLIGWWRFVIQTAKAYLALDDAEFGPAKAPLMRNLIGHVSPMAWLLDNKGAGINATRTYGYNMQKKLADEVRSQSWEIADQIPNLVEPNFAFNEGEAKFHAKLVGELANYNNILTAYGASSLYPVYRVLSSLSHTTVQSAMAYIEDVNGSPAVSRVVNQDTNAPVILLAVCLIQAGNVVSSLLVGRPLRNVLRRAALDLGVTDMAVPRARHSNSVSGT